jgi:hypothetical protein
MQKKICFLLIIVLYGFRSQAQNEDTKRNVWLLFAHVGGDLPGGDLKNRFGTNVNFGAGLMLKTKKNWLLNVEGGYLFGNTLRENTLQTALTRDGFILANDGELAVTRLFQRGVRLPILRVGRMFPIKLFSANEHSGIFVLAGGTFLKHWIHIQDMSRNTAYFRDDYKKGYDRMTNGLGFSESIGYMFLDQKKLINFYVATDFTQAFTTSRATFYEYKLGQTVQKQRLDMLWGIRVGLVIPVYGRNPDDFYYY